MAGPPFLFMSRVSNKRYFVYVLWSDTGQRFYIGISEDPHKRLEQHNAGEAPRWTKRYFPWQLVFTEKRANYREARQRELELKAQKGGQGFFLKTGLNPADFGRAA